MGTTLMDQYMKMTATAFIHQAVQGVINKIVEMKQSCEVSTYYEERLTGNDKQHNYLVWMGAMQWNNYNLFHYELSWGEKLTSTHFFLAHFCRAPPLFRKEMQ